MLQSASRGVCLPYSTSNYFEVVSATRALGEAKEETTSGAGRILVGLGNFLRRCRISLTNKKAIRNIL